MRYWKYEDMLAGLCGARDIGRLRGAAEPEIPEVMHLDTSPENIVRTAIQTLLYAAGQTRDLTNAVKAAAALLRYYAPPQRLSPAADRSSIPDASWLTHRRLAYQEEQNERLEHPSLANGIAKSPPS